MSSKNFTAFFSSFFPSSHKKDSMEEPSIFGNLLVKVSWEFNPGPTLPLLLSTDVLVLQFLSLLMMSRETSTSASMKLRCSRPPTPRLSSSGLMVTRFLMWILALMDAIRSMDNLSDRELREDGEKIESEQKFKGKLQTMFIIWP